MVQTRCCWYVETDLVPTREHPEAFYELALVYEVGYPNVPKDLAYARLMLEEAVGFGYPPAIYKLAHSYEHVLMGYPYTPVLPV